MRHRSLIVLAALPFLAHGQQPVTVDFLATKGDDIHPARWMTWIKQHDLLLADETGKTGGIISLDAATGRKTHIGDERTLASLRAAKGPNLDKLPIPDAVDQTGKYLGYAFEEGFFLLEIQGNQFKHLTTQEGAQEFHFSPDASWVSYVSDNDLYLTSTLSDQTKRLTTTGKPNLLNGTMTWVYWEEIYGHDSNATWWSPDSKQIAFFETDESPVPPTTYVDYRPQYVTTKTQCYPKPGNANPIVRLKIADVETGEITSIPAVESQEYIVGVKWAEPGKLLFATYNRAQTECRYNLFDTLNQKLSTITVDTGKWLEVNTDFDLIDGGSALLFASSRTGYDHYYRAPLSGGKPTPITQGRWQIESNVEGPTAMQHLDKENGRILFTCTKDSILERQVYSVKTDGSGLKRITRGRGYHYLLASNDGKYFTDEWSNIETPAVTRVWTVDGKPLQVVDTGHPEMLKQIHFTQEKFITIPARDGVQLPAKLRMPRKMVAGKRYPVIVHVYGGPESPMVIDRWSWFWAYDQLLSDNGYVVLSVDCRTATLMSKSYLAANRGHFYGAQERNDFVDAARWIKKQRYADPNRVGIWGWSGGGANTINCLLNTNEFKAGIAGAFCSDPLFYDTFYMEHLYGLPKENPAGYREAAFWRDTKNLHGKLLMLWGSADDNVQQQHALAFVDACIGAGKSVQMMVYPNRKHGVGDVPGKRHLIQTCLDFWKANL